MPMTRRTFLKVLGQVTATYAIGGAGLFEYGRRVEPAWVVVEKVRVPVAKLPPDLAGFKIVQLSDIHIDAHTKIETVSKAVALANSLKPDLIVVTGDYVSRQPEAIFDLAPVLASLDARWGVFTILGNHELWTNPELVRSALEQTGLPVLVNQGVTLGSGRRSIYLAGVDDGWSGRPDLVQALAGRSEGLPTVLLAHEPDLADTFCRDGRVALQLSGHSHGGQIRLPGLGAIILPQYGRKYDQGLYNVNGMWLYTNRGLGLAPAPIRINCPPEVTEITLSPQNERSIFYDQPDGLELAAVLSLSWDAVYAPGRWR